MIKCYEVTYDSEIFAISLVEDPAIEEDFIYLSKNTETKPIFLEKEDKHLIIGPVLIPNQKIYRNDGQIEYYIQFSEKTIEQLAYNYMKNGFYKNFTKDHKTQINNVSIVESWLKTSDNDKSNDYGYNLPNGTWFIAAKVDDEDLFQKIKSREIKGFSIESFLNLNELNIQNNMQKENLEQIEITDSFWDKLRSIISDALGLSPKDEKVEETVGKIVDEVEINAEPGKEGEDKIVEMEVIEEVKDEAVIDVAENVEKKILTEQDKIDTLQATIDELQAKVNELNSEMESKNLEIEQLKEKNIKLSKQPSVNPNVKGNKNENKYSFLDYAQGKIKI